MTLSGQISIKKMPVVHLLTKKMTCGNISRQDNNIVIKKGGPGDADLGEIIALVRGRQR